MNKFSKYLTIWIILAMLIGAGIGFIPGTFEALNGSNVMVGPYNIILTIFLILMMIPAFMKIKFGKSKDIIKDYKVILLSIFLNWIVGPLLMFGLAIGILANSEMDFRTGIIIVGLSRCIAMVVVWNEMAKGSKEHCIVIVIINSIMQIILLSVYIYLFTDKFPSLMGVDVSTGSIGFSAIIESVSIYLFLPFVIGIILHYVIEHFKGKAWYDNVFIKPIDLIGGIALLITIGYLFALKAKDFNNYPIPGLKIIAILLIYFMIMYSLSMTISWLLHWRYEIAVTISFTAASNNFELAIAVTVALFGASSAEAFAAVIGPLIEVPVMIGLVKVSELLKSRFKFEPQVMQIKPYF